MTSTLRTHHAKVVAVGCLALASLALILGAPSATRAGAIAPALDIGPVTIANGTAMVSGQARKPATTSVALNGHPVALDAGGKFTAVADVTGQTVLTLTAKTGRETTTTTIPLSLTGSGGVIPAGVLDALKRAGVSVTIPPDGLASVDGKPVALRGAVASRGQLAGLEVGGRDVLGTLGSNGTFVQQVPGTTKEVNVTATDRQGVSETRAFQIGQTSSIIQTKAGKSVSSAGAAGLRITAIRFSKKRIKTTKHLTAVVTLKDRRGYLVRSAIVSVRGMPVRAVRGGEKVKRSDRIGRARFVLRPRLTVFGKRLRILVRARTPSARAQRKSTVRLPRLNRHRRSRAHG